MVGARVCNDARTNVQVVGDRPTVLGSTDHLALKGKSDADHLQMALVLDRDQRSALSGGYVAVVGGRLVGLQTPHAQ